MTDVYRDTEERYQRDPAFYSAVRTMETIAREHGFTPGELKQIAFKAALNIEETRAHHRLRPSAKSGTAVQGLCAWCAKPNGLQAWMHRDGVIRFCSPECCNAYERRGGSNL